MKKLIKISPYDCIPYANNPRLNKRSIAQLVVSLDEFGFVKPILLDENNVIICGHTVREAAIVKGLTSIDAVVTDELTEDRKAAYRIADNRLAEFSKWDPEKLFQEINERAEFDWFAAGYTPGDIEKLSEQVENSAQAAGYHDNETCKYPIVPVFNERYDYVVIFCKNQTDFAKLQSLLGLKKSRSYKNSNIGLSRVVPFEDFNKIWESRND
ncbi:MAG: ParB/Srx family N-terminal domain-containing protein [candidate division KSB1 bacterium]|nr:ParB/Srx family N-terminal domain-containing protein [candidate division KSB1 bacterium]